MVVVAPPIVSQLPASAFPPSVPHRFHWYAYEIGVTPLHEPEDTLRVAPWTGEPEMRGSAVFFGAEPSVTRAVGFEAAVALPEPLLAVTRTRMRVPTSEDVSVSVEAFAPPIAAQLLPSALPPSVPQRTHWYAYEIGVTPLQEPEDALSVLPLTGDPLIVGSVVLFGAAASTTTDVASESAVPEPSAFVAVTRTRRR